MKWQQMLKMDDNALLAKGVAALGARRKLLKVFEQIKAHCQANVSIVEKKRENTHPFIEHHILIFPYEESLFLAGLYYFTFIQIFL